MNEQMQYVAEKDLGFDKEQIVVIPANGIDGGDGRTNDERLTAHDQSDIQADDLDALRALDADDLD